MLGYYAMFIAATLVTQVNSVYIYKKYQLTAGTSLPASVLYMIINGIVSAIVPAIVIAATGAKFEFTPYSLIFAAATVICAAVSTILQFKAYEEGQIATVNIMVTIGGIVIPSLWGVLFLKEELSVQGMIGILQMLCAVVLIMGKSGEKLNKKLVWMYLTMVLCACLVTMLGKQHQVETRYATVDTLSYSVWIGVVRTVLFAMLIPYLLKRDGKKVLKAEKAPVVYATVSSVLSGGAYIVTLFTAAVLPVVITSPLGTGIGILMSSFLPWITYHEKLEKKQLWGVALSFVGVLVYLINM